VAFRSGSDPMLGETARAFALPIAEAVISLGRLRQRQTSDDAAVLLAAGPIDVNTVWRVNGLVAVRSGADRKGGLGVWLHAVVPCDASGVAAADPRAV
jgi:hypothetical protein